MKSVAFVSLFLLVPSLSGAVSFSEEILPILSDRCFSCHGPDSASRKAGLRLDHEDAARKTLGDLSVLVDRLTSDDPDEVMPPPSSKISVSADEVALIKQWLSERLEEEISKQGD